MTGPGWVLAGLLAAPLPRCALAQVPDLAPTAERARQSLQAHDVNGLLGSSSRILLQLPAVTPSAPVGRPHAAALLSSYLNEFEEVSTEVQSVALAGEHSGTVELRRTFRVAGTTAVRIQSVLLAYEFGDGRWNLTEVRISG